MIETQLFGLIGYPLGHSFSKQYFMEKWEREQITNTKYELFPMEAIEHLPALLDQKPNLRGLNVTIPYKQSVLAYLDHTDPMAASIGAVNCIKINPDGILTGYNTDAIGFQKSLQYKEQGRWATPFTRAIVLGNGGAARAVRYVLGQLGMSPIIISRKPTPNDPNAYHWDALPEILTNSSKQTPDLPVLIVNTTPVGMVPDSDGCPNIPFELLNSHFLVFDLIYNPAETVLLRCAQERGCATLNGLEMLHLQADAAWQIWND